jgi:2'-5' RNA ligase
MPYAVVMHVEQTTATRIVKLWDILAKRDDAGRVIFSDEQIRFNYPPHITLTVVDNADTDAVVEALKPIVASWAPLTISFDSIAVLPRKPIAPMILRPNVTAEILKLHKEVFDVLPSNSTSVYHRPNTWQPHVTLARDIPPETLGDALTAVLEQWNAFETTLDQVAVVYFTQQGKSEDLQEVWRVQLSNAVSRKRSSRTRPKIRTAGPTQLS